MKRETFLKRIPLFLIFCFLVFTVPIVVQAVSLYLLPRAQTIYQNDTFVVEVRLDTEGEEINAVDVPLQFSSEILEALDFSKGNSLLTLWVLEPQITEGEIVFSGGRPGGFSGDGILGRITMRGKETGKAHMGFGDEMRILLNDGVGTKAEVSVFPGNYEIITKPENLPIISSRSHADSS